MSHVDLHLHLLPGVDDGARTERESLEHAARMERDGVREAVCTPHIGHPAFPVAIGEIAARTAELQTALRRAGIGVRLHAGGEIHPDVAASLSAAELRLIAQGPPGSRWVLAEVPFTGIDEGFLEGCRSIRRQGFGIVIAHPERAAGLLDGGLTMLRDELRAGAVLQVNVCSLLGRNGDEARRAAERLIRARLAYVLASDGHPGTREDTLAAGVAAAQAAGASAVQAWQLTESNPRFLLRHGLPVGPALPVRAWRSPREASLSAARDAAQRLMRVR
jgi:protein-tyrosine phosphatase